jgi:cytochrome c oxidase assembly protein subunit 15
MDAWRRWAWVTAAFVFAIDLVGFLDTATGSAMGCGPDWPLCHGAVVPVFGNVHVIIEFAHRALVALGALEALGYYGLVWWRWRRVPAIARVALVGWAFLIIQSIMGALAVVFVNPPGILALHLGFGLMALVPAVILATGFRANTVTPVDAPPFRPRTRRWLAGLWIYFYAVMYVGSYVSFRDAGAACLSWPWCPATWPPWESPADLDLVHRILAASLLVVVVIAGRLMLRDCAGREDLKRRFLLTLLLVLVQAGSGAVLVATRLALWAYLVHVSLLMGLFSVLSEWVWRALFGAESTEKRVDELELVPRSG